MADWDLVFRGEVIEAAVGQQFAYYILQSPNAYPDAPGRAKALPAVNPYGQPNDWRTVVICVRLADGTIAWFRLVNSMAHLAVDPRDDNLHLYMRGCITLAAKDGSIVKQIERLGESDLHGVIVASQIIANEPEALRRDPHLQWRLLNLDTGSLQEIDMTSKRLLSPDEKYRLVHSAGSCYQIQCDRLTDNSTLWINRLDNVGQPLPQRVPPVWFKGKIYWLTGEPDRKTQILCLADDTGQTLWQHTLPDGRYASTSHYLPSEAASVPVSPFTVTDQIVTVLDNAGRLYFFDPLTGESRGSLHAARDYLCPPVVRNDHLIVCAFTAMRSYPLNKILAGAPKGTVLAGARKSLADGYAD